MIGQGDGDLFVVNMREPDLSGGLVKKHKPRCLMTGLAVHPKMGVMDFFFAMDRVARSAPGP
jgi:hypothetical protein